MTSPQIKQLPERSPAARWLSRIRTRFPLVFCLLVIAVVRPHGSWWGLALVALGQALRVWSAGWLRKDHILTTGGPFAHVRNPLYLGTLTSAVGLFLVIGDWRWAAAFLLIFALLYSLTVQEEESYLAATHGEAYYEYRRRVPRLLPSPRPRVPGAGRFSWDLVRENREHQTLIGVAVLVALLWLRQHLAF